MPKDNITPRTTFTEAQVSVANVDLERAIAKLEEKTIGSHFNPRQRDILLAAFKNYEAEKEGREVKKMPLGEYEINVAGHFGVTPLTIKTDIERTGSLMEKVPMKGSNQKKVYWMSDEGAEKYRMFEQGKAALILEAAERIKDHGAIPTGWRKLIAPMFVVLAVFSAQFVPSAGRANGMMSDYPIGTQNSFQGVYFEAQPAYRQAVINHTWESNASAMNALMGGISWRSKAPSNGLPLVQIVDRSSFFDEHLPKMQYNFEDGFLQTQYNY